MAKAALESNLLQQLNSLLGECTMLGGRMIEVCNDPSSDGEALMNIYQRRTALVEQIEPLLKQAGVDWRRVSKSSEKRTVEEKIQLVLEQNRQLHVLVTQLQQQTVVNMEQLGRTERAGKAYRQWHPIQIAGMEHE